MTGLIYYKEIGSDLVIVKPSREEAEVARMMIESQAKNFGNMIPRTSKFILDNCFIARLEGKVIGTIGVINWNGDGAEIVSHIVYENLRQRGIGSELLRAALKKAEEFDPLRIFLFTNIPRAYGKYFIPCENLVLGEKAMADCDNCPNGPRTCCKKESLMILAGYPRA